MRKLLFIFLLLSQVAYGQLLTGPFDEQDIIIPEPAPDFQIFVNQAFVGTSTGSFTNPWKTIQDAATVAIAGQNVGIYAGEYRETVVPTNSGTASNPITYQAVPGQTVTLNGTELVGSTGWSVHSGQIYKKTITLPVNGYNNTTTNNTTILANQVFKDKQMMFEARWPNIDDIEDLWDRNAVRPMRTGGVTTPTNATVVDAAAPAGMTGAKMWLNGWYVTYGATITGHSGSTLTFSPTQTDVKKRKYYFLTGKLSLLDVEKEWHYESGTLYFRQVGGGTPSGTLEYKARNYGFDLSGKDYITIKGLEFFACEIKGSTSTDNCTIDDIHTKFQNHVIMSPIQSGTIMNTTYVNAEQTGIRLIGNNNVIKNSVLEYMASQGVWLGENGRMENNLVHHGGYDGNFGCAFMPWGPNIGSGGTGGQKFLHNTVYTMGRSCIDAGHSEHGQHLNMEIAYNDLYDYCKLNTDGGAFYVGHFTNTTGLVTHHNWFHTTGGVIDDGIIGGLYYDQGSGPSWNHHNVFWDNIPTVTIAVGGGTDYFATPDYEDRNAGPSRIENSTFASTSSIGDTHSYKTSTFVKDQQRNNIYREDAICCGFSTTEPNITFSLKMATNPIFLGTGAGGLAFRLGGGSPAINTGTVIAGVTDGSVGVPDMGAYEVGDDWVPGYSEAVDPPPPDPEDDSEYLIDAEDFVAKVGCFSDGSILFGIDAGDNASYTFTFTSPKDVFYINYSRATAGTGTAEIRLGSAGGTLLGTISLPTTGSWAAFNTVSQAITSISGTQTFFIVFPSGANVCNVNFYEFKND